MKMHSAHSPAPHRAAPVATGLSACLVLAMILSGCATLHPPLEEQIAGGSYLPRSAGEYRLVEQPTVTAPELFYHALAGAAGPFLDFNPRRIFHFAYQEVGAGRLTLHGTLIVLGSPLEAWGLESRLRLAAGGGAVTGAPTAGRAFFARDVVLLSIEAGQEESAQAAAGALARALPGEGKPPREVSALGSLTPTTGEPFYEPVTLLGSTLLAPALAAPLAGVPDGGRVLVFLAVKASAPGAARAFEQYLASRNTGRRGVSFTLGVGESAGTAWDEHFGWVNLAREGNTLVGVAGLPGPGDGWPLVAQVLAALRR